MKHAFSKTKFLALIAALVAAVLSVTPASALSAPKRQALASASSDGVIKVHSKNVHSKRHYHKRHHKHAYKHHRRHRIVEAPFTRVETRHRYRRDVLVDAPFAFVAVNRHGRYVRAPFVDLWVPN